MSVSLPAFCIKLNCTPNDFFDVNSNHPKDLGVSIIADLVIWQFLLYFRRILRKECTIVYEDMYKMNITNHNFSWILSDLKNDNYSISFQESAKNLIQNLPEIFSGEKIFLIFIAKDFKHDLTLYILSSGSFEKYNIIASLILYSPQIRRPLPIFQFAILCLPSIDNTSTFIINQSLPDMKESLWTEVNIVSIMKAKCSGWKNNGERHESRADDTHIYVPTSTPDCPTGGVPMLGQLCHYPDWGIYRYPHKSWREMPMVKSVDMLFRLSTSIQWSHFCFNVNNCKPIILWKESSTWKNVTMLNKQELSFHVCFINDFVNLFNNVSYIYIWIPADVCFPLNNSTDNIWEGVYSSSHLYLLNS